MATDPSRSEPWPRRAERPRSTHPRVQCWLFTAAFAHALGPSPASSATQEERRGDEGDLRRCATDRNADKSSDTRTGWPLRTP